jgi:hypothetical protein
MATAESIVGRLVQLDAGGADDRAFDISGKEVIIGRCVALRAARNALDALAPLAPGGTTFSLLRGQMARSSSCTSTLHRERS